MKKLLFVSTLILLSILSANAFQTDSISVDSLKKEGFKFTTVKENPITSIKNQYRSSTCWSFSGMAFFESELLRMGKGNYDLSEMFVVHHTMLDRAQYYVRLHGDGSFSPGGSFYDDLFCLQNYGLMPQEAYPGLMYGDTLPNHGELDAVAKAYVDAIAKSNSEKLTPVWLQGLDKIYDTYLGVIPKTFVYKGVTYTPMSFAKMLGLNADDYVSITSYTHHPFYKPFALEVQDNWRQALSYNLPMDEMVDVIKYAVEHGYTVAWGADVSEIGFTRDGVGVVPDDDKGAELTGTDMDHWLKMSKTDKRKELTSYPLPEKKVTQEMRQKAFDDWQTTDDHGMLIFGIAKDQTGKLYFMVKNSWGTNYDYKGIWYVSEDYVKYKTMNYVVNKAALPKDIAKKLGLK